jgi:hypothetical protein
MQDDLLQRARETHLLMERPLSRFGSGVATLIIQGEKQPTPTWVTRDGSKLITTDNKPGSRSELAFGETKGDTLVPSERTVDWAGALFGGRTLRLSGKVKEHAFLCDGKFVIKKIGEFLKDPAPPAPPAPTGG